jgi:SAM-dependent methyltransferase
MVLMRLFGRFWRVPQSAFDEEAAPKRWNWFAGRRLLLTSPYVLPKDTAEGGRLDLQHHLLKVAFGRNYASRLRTPRMILDVACGTGAWGRDLALEFKRAQVIGFDFDRTPLEAALKLAGPGGRFPANFQFIEADALKRFPFGDNTFDFSFARLIAPFVPANQWPHVIGEMARVTRLGGSVEVADSGGFPVSPSPAFTTLVEAMKHLMSQRGLYTEPRLYLADLLSQGGVSRVKVRHMSIGTGNNALRQQRMLAADMLSAGATMAPIFIKLGMFSQEKCDALLVRAREEVARWALPGTLPGPLGSS